jgi:acetoin utilization protein AcuB
MSLVSEAMTPKVWVVKPDTLVVDALQVAACHDVEHLPVLEHEHLVGLVCTCDLESARLNAPVSTVMHTPARTIQVDDSIDEAAALMQDDDVGSLVVLAGSAIVGLLTKDDLARQPDDGKGLERCSACGSYQHLRPAPPGSLQLCVECSEREHPPFDPAELGTGD